MELKPNTSFSKSYNLVRNLPHLVVALCVAFALPTVVGQTTQPLVAIHDSELTRALESMSAVPPTPSGAGTTGFQWWTLDWHYFTMPEAAKEALRSDGTAFTTIGDSNVTAGVLLTNGQPRYPICISFASEAIRDDEIAQFTNYVAAGGFLMVGSSAFTRNTNGTTRGDFAFGNAMGLHMVMPGLTNWTLNNYFTNQTNHRIASHIPSGQLTWRMPTSADEIPWGISPSHPFLAPHDLWRVQASDATVLAQGDSSPYLCVKQYGKGYFIYYAGFQPLIGHSGFAPGMYAYTIIRKSIEWAFESANLPIPKLSPWPYQYDAAMMVRHDLENFTNEIAAIEASAQVEFTNGTKGDYYFCTGTVRDDAPNPNTIIAGMRRAVTNYGATISQHNGGLKNPNNPSLVRGQYDYWHWGPDEALDVTPAGYPSGKAYASASISNAFLDIESWLSGITNGMRIWCGCYFNSTRDDSYDLLNQLGVDIAGEEKNTPFPHWTFSMRTPGKRYSFLSQPVSDWFVGGLVAQSLEPWHPPGVETSQTMHNGVDFYYSQGFLINFYSHTLSTGLGDAGQLVPDYITYCMNTNLHPRLWPANAVGVYQWWLARSNAQVSASYATNGYQMATTISISGATDTNTSVELLAPGTNSFCAIQVLTNGVLAGGNSYRINGQLLKLRVGTSVTNAVISYYPAGPPTQIFKEAFDGVSAPNLPAGWTTSASNAQSGWITTNTTIDTAPNAAFSPDPTNIGINELVSPTISMPVGQTLLAFRNNYDLEVGVGGSAYDGGVLEIKIGTNAFADILAAGGSFVSGGYTNTISSGFGNPLAGRQAWSGNSGGYITTIANLPATASGQSIQLRWRCGSDNANNRSGWRIDTVAITNSVCLCCVTPNTPPVLQPQTNYTIVELTGLIVTNSATDSDVPANILSYSLVNPPAGAAIDSNGVISWTPNESQGPGTNTISTIVTDNGFPPMSATNSFTVIVTEVNRAPVLPVQTNRTMAALSTLTVTNTANDPDIPANTLTYSLLAAPTNAAISANGIITWSPDSGQALTTNIFTTRVVDNGSPSFSATNTFSVVVLGNPVIAINSTSLAVESCLPTNNAIDPGETITVLFALKNNGNGNTANLVATLLSTNGIAAPSGPQNYGALIVGASAVSQPFTFAATGGCGGTIIATLQLQDGTVNLGTSTVVFQLGQATNIFSENFDSITAPALPGGWTTSATGFQSNWVTQTAVRDTLPNAGFSPDAANTGVNELVSPPIALPLGSSQLSFRNNYDLEYQAAQPTNAYDGGVLEIKIGTNVFADILMAGGSFVSNGYPATINTNFGNPLGGRKAWSGNSGGFTNTLVNLPAAAAGQTVQLRWRCGSDNGVGNSGWRIDTVNITARACCLNTAPALPAQTDRTIGELTTLVVTNTATDSSTASTTLTYVLVNPPAGAQVSTNGVITWAPTETQGPSTNTITTIVTDNAFPPLSATNSFTVTVAEVNSAPVLPSQAARTITELATLTVTNTASDGDIPVNGLSYTLLGGPSGAQISASGIITWTPTEAQGPSTNAFTTVVTDDGVPPLSATNSFTVVVTEVNTPPVLPLQADRTIAEFTALVVTNTASDSDLPPNLLAYILLSAPSGGQIDGNGVITWTALGKQGLGGSTFTTVVTDNGQPPLSATNSFTVTVTNVPSAPMILSIQVIDGASVITWSTTPGRTYQVEGKTNVADSNWISLPPPVTATGSTASATNLINGASQQCYRVVLLP
jgi:hypothetical protein